MSFLSEIVEFWKETWEESKLVFFLEASGTIMGMVAATIMNFGSKDPNMLAVLTLYGISAVFLVYTSYHRKNLWMVVLMAFYSIVTVIGLVKLFT